MENQQGGPPDVASRNKKHPVVSKHFFADYLLRLPDAFLPLFLDCVTNWQKILGTPFNGCIGAGRVEIKSSPAIN
jgi:hypothetical protein